MRPNNRFAAAISGRPDKAGAAPRRFCFAGAAGTLKQMGRYFETERQSRGIA